MKVLITGIAGFVGSSLCKVLQKDCRLEIFGVDDLSFGHIERCAGFQERIVVKTASVQDYLCSESSKFDLIINTAAIAPLPENQINHHRSIETSLGVAASIVDYCLRTGCNNIIHISTSAVYEGAGDQLGPSKETDPVKPHLMYPLSKYLVEQYLEQQAHVYGMDINCIRLFNLYGPHQDYFRKQPPLLGYLLKNIIQDQPVTIFSKGKAVRDYIYIDDLVDLIKTLSMGSVGGYNIINAGTGSAYNVDQMIEACNEVANKKLNVIRGNTQDFWRKYPELVSAKIPLPHEFIEREVEKNSIADISKAREVYGWEPKFNLRRGLKVCHQHAKELLS